MSHDAPEVSDKQIALETIRRLPEGATLQQISEEMALLAALRRGAAEADQGRVVSHNEAIRRSAMWIAS